MNIQPVFRLKPGLHANLAQSNSCSVNAWKKGQAPEAGVAEDNALNQLLAKRTLEKAGHSVAVANNGEEAVAAVGRESFDRVLMDVQMAVMDGFLATARIREQEQTTGRHQQIVAMMALVAQTVAPGPRMTSILSKSWGTRSCVSR